MRLRNIPGADDVIANSPYVVHDPEQRKGAWREVFGNDHPIHIEVGMGKGRFLTEMAMLHPQINYVGIERYTSVLLRALQRREKLSEELPNLCYLCTDAALLPEIFGNEEVGKIYLNFSDPWPKERHARRRLPSKEFLERYDKILKAEGTVEFKTDNMDLFEFALEQRELAGWKLEACTRNLHADEVMNQGNVMTEYEEKFSALGNPIYKMIISREPA